MIGPEDRRGIGKHLKRSERLQHIEKSTKLVKRCCAGTGRHTSKLLLRRTRQKPTLLGSLRCPFLHHTMHLSRLSICRLSVQRLTHSYVVQVRRKRAEAKERRDAEAEGGKETEKVAAKKVDKNAKVLAFGYQTLSDLSCS